MVEKDIHPKKLSEISSTKEKAKVQEYLKELPESVIQIDEYGGKKLIDIIMNLSTSEY